MFLMVAGNVSGGVRHKLNHAFGTPRFTGFGGDHGNPRHAITAAPQFPFIFGLAVGLPYLSWCKTIGFERYAAARSVGEGIRPRFP